MKSAPKELGRRRFLGSFIAAGAVVATHHAAHAQTTVKDDDPGTPDMVEAGIDFVKCVETFSPILNGPQTYTLLGDTNHDNFCFTKLLAHPAFLAAANRAEIKHVCIEFDASRDQIFRDIAEGRIKKYSDYNILGLDPTHEDYFVIAALNARKHGIQFHAVDKVSTAALADNFKSDVNHVTQWPKSEDYGGDINQLRADIEIAEKDPRFQAQYDLRLKFINERYGNLDTSDNIRKAANGEKTLVFYGAGHHMASCGQAQLLGDSKMVHLYQYRQEMDWFYQTASDPIVAKAFPADFSTPPDAVAILSENILTHSSADLVDKMKTLAVAFPSEASCPAPARRLPQGSLVR